MLATMTTNTTSTQTHRRGLRAVPVWVWLLALVGGAVGALLAEPGNFWGNTVPSAATFLVAGLVLGLVTWAVRIRLRGAGG
jgi:hypothetical protein